MGTGPAMCTAVSTTANAFTDDGCDITFDVVGHARGFEVIYNVPGSGGQAFLDDNRYRYREVWTNPENDRKAYVSGRADYQELFATHLHGDVWKFITSTTGRSSSSGTTTARWSSPSTAGW
ncbi:MAG: hypothetical protein JWN91_984 [Nocardioides sp.]|nr:hypothetical protein [Nocardioides sp.]